jgi:biopolymer transport protein ExbB
MIQAEPLSSPASSADLDSLFDFLVAGGPLMIPIGICSVLALAYAIERSIRLRAAELGSPGYGRRILAAHASAGRGAALEVVQAEDRPLGRILATGLRRSGAPRLEREKAVEDAGAREVKRLTAKLRPLVVIGVIAPLLGLLGTVWGIIEAFADIAHSQALGRPDLLAGGIYQALITTAAGLVVAIPTQTAYFWFRSRIDHFVARAEDLYDELEAGLHGASAPAPDVAAPTALVAGGAS